MPNTFPCPNVQCTYQFDAEVLPARAWVTCPLCRTRFKYEAQRPTASAPPPTADEEGFPSGPRVVSLRHRPKRGGLLSVVLWLAGFTAVLGGLLAAVYTWTRPKAPAAAQTVREERLNLTIDPLGPEWQEDTAARAGLNVNVFARKKSDADVWAALYAQDFGERTPRPGEVRDLVRDRLNSYGGVGIAIADKDGATWLGRPAVAYQFQGDFGDLPVIGESFSIVYKGIAYVLFVWARDRDWEAAQGSLAAVRDKVKLAGYRENWVEKKNDARTYSTEDGAYEVEDPDGVWRRARVFGEDERPTKNDYNADPKEFGPEVAMAFKASFQIKAGGDARQRAAEPRALVVELPKAADPLAAATAHLIERIKKSYADSPPEVVLEPLAKSPAGVPLPTDGPTMARLVFRDPQSRGDVQLYIVSAMTVGNKTVVVEADVEERHAAYVEAWMVHLAASLKAK